MLAGTYNFLIQRGATLRKVIEWRDSAGDLVSLDGYDAQMQVRRDTPRGTIVYDMTVGDGIELELHGDGTIDISLSAQQTTDAPACLLVYDLLLTTPDNRKIRFLQGEIEVSPEVTIDETP